MYIVYAVVAVYYLTAESYSQNVLVLVHSLVWHEPPLLSFNALYFTSFFF